jgi:hypothetical protein
MPERFTVISVSTSDPEVTDRFAVYDTELNTIVKGGFIGSRSVTDSKWYADRIAEMWNEAARLERMNRKSNAC